MADIFDAGKRSDVMRQIKSKKNKSTELRLIEIFKQNGITGWRRNYPVKGHPDFIFPKKKIAVFEARGWTVLRIWECELQKKNLDGTVEKIKQILSVERYPGR